MTAHPLRATAIDILAALVSFDTTSSKSNQALIDWVESYLGGQGVASVRIPDPEQDKSSLFATIGPEGIGGVGLSGHTDVVPVEGQNWTSDPFTLVARDGKLYGRGACDMKGFLACALAMVQQFKHQGLRVPIHLLFSYDEEIGCTGVLPMIDRLGVDLPKPRVVFVGEPTEMTVVDAHKGPCRWVATLKGRAVHSSLADRGVNTIHYASRLLAELSLIEAELAQRRDERFDPPYTTLQVTQINAGRASNIVPEECWFGWEIRGVPGANADAVEQRIVALARTLETEMRTRAPEAEIAVMRTNYVPPFAADAEGAALPLALKLAGTNETFAVAYATEASHFAAHAMSTIVCGPGNIAQAHTPDEWIAVEELDKCLGFMDRLAAWCSGADATLNA